MRDLRCIPAGFRYGLRGGETIEPGADVAVVEVRAADTAENGRRERRLRRLPQQIQRALVPLACQLAPTRRLGAVGFVDERVRKTARAGGVAGRRYRAHAVVSVGLS